MALKSWVESANLPHCDFPLANLPYGVFSHRGAKRIGVAIGDQVLDLRACVEEDLLGSLPSGTAEACSAASLNALMALGHAAWTALRHQLTKLLSSETAPDTQQRAKRHLLPVDAVHMEVPAHIGDYTDFYASIHHATRVGKLFRPDNPLLPNYKYVPIG
ncbi:MAG TPA: fumarylacetoacetase, partial [Terriglobales bacterium]